MTANPNATDKQGYHKFKGHGPLVDEGWGSFEVFWEAADVVVTNAKGEVVRPGWYWWACFPGCMPDGDPAGPFNTSQQAYADAQEVA